MGYTRLYQVRWAMPSYMVPNVLSPMGYARYIQFGLDQVRWAMSDWIKSGGLYLLYTVGYCPLWACVFHLIDGVGDEVGSK